MSFNEKDFIKGWKIVDIQFCLNDDKMQQSLNQTYFIAIADDWVSQKLFLYDFGDKNWKPIEIRHETKAYLVEPL